MMRKQRELSNEERCEDELRQLLNKMNFKEDQTITYYWLKKSFSNNMPIIKANVSNIASALAPLIGVSFTREYYRTMRGAIYFLESNLYKIRNVLAEKPFVIKYSINDEVKEVTLLPPPTSRPDYI